MLKYCLTCDGHHPVGQTCARREAERYAASRQRRIRSTAAWQKARAAARRRDGERCTACSSNQNLEVHHVVALAKGGRRFALSNLTTLCRECHQATERGAGSTRPASRSHAHPLLGEIQPHNTDPASEPEILIG
jgi:5-methylcytosine-specific restriction endonuclease McrA